MISTHILRHSIEVQYWFLKLKTKCKKKTPHLSKTIVCVRNLLILHVIPIFILFLDFGEISHFPRE